MQALTAWWAMQQLYASNWSPISPGRNLGSAGRIGLAWSNLLSSATITTCWDTADCCTTTTVLMSMRRCIGALHAGFAESLRTSGALCLGELRRYLRCRSLVFTQFLPDRFQTMLIYHPRFIKLDLRTPWPMERFMAEAAEADRVHAKISNFTLELLPKAFLRTGWYHTTSPTNFRAYCPVASTGR